MTPNKNHTQQQQQQPTAAAIVAASMSGQAAPTSITSTANSIVGGAPTLAATVAAMAAGHSPALQQHAPAPSLNATNATPSVGGAATMAATVVTSNGNSNSNNNIQGQSVIQAAPTIAFAAVAKNNTCKWEDMLKLPYLKIIPIFFI